MKKTPILFLLLASTFLSANAEAQSRKLVLNLEQAIKLAVDNNRELQAAHLDMDKADYRVGEAIGTALPNVTASGMYTNAVKKPVFFLPDFTNPSSGRIIPFEIGADHSIQFGIQATQILFNTAVFTGVGTAKIYQRASREMFRNSYNQTVANVKRAFHGVLFAQSVHGMMQASMKNAEDNYKNLELRAKSGIVSEYDLIRAQVQTENIRPQVIDAERSVLTATNGLKILLGVDPKQEIEVKDSLEVRPVDPALLATAEERAAEENASLRALKFQTEVNDALISIYKSESLPTLAAFGNYLWQSQNNALNFSANNARSLQVGLNLTWNIFNGLQTRARINQAEADYHKSLDQLESATFAMQTNIQSIRLRLESAQKRIEAQGLNVEQAEKGYRIAVTRFQTGSGTQLEVNDADVALLRARVNRAQAIYDYLVAKADLEEALSVLTP